MTSTDVKQQQIKELEAVSCKCLQDVFSKFEIQCKTDVYF